jgi:hypothetical protein
VRKKLRKSLPVTTCRKRAAGERVTRRSLLGAAAGLLTLPLLPGAAAARRSLNLDLDDPVDRLMALVKLRGSLDGRMVMWWMKGVRYGVVDDILQPLFGMLIGSFQQLMPTDRDDSYILNMLELSYFTDLDTGAVLDTFTNPYNGKLCEVPEQRLGPYPVEMTPTGVVLPDVPAFGDVKLTTRVGPAIVSGDDVWLRDDSSVKVDSDHPMMGKHTYNELVTYHGSLSQINDPDVASADADIAFQSVTSWREWLRAEDVGGHTTARATGRKIYRSEDFPPDYQAAARDRHGEIFADPEAALNAPPEEPGGH